MDQPKARRVTRDLTPEEQERLHRAREEAAANRPELIAQARKVKAAYEEQTVSGEFRRAIIASRRPIADLAAQLGLPLEQMHAFMTGDGPLPSDALDRLANELGLRIQAVPAD
jgi:hypothetical protein